MSHCKALHIVNRDHRWVYPWDIGNIVYFALFGCIYILDFCLWQCCIFILTLILPISFILILGSLMTLSILGNMVYLLFLDVYTGFLYLTMVYIHIDSAPLFILSDFGVSYILYIPAYYWKRWQYWFLWFDVWNLQ